MNSVDKHPRSGLRVDGHRSMTGCRSHLKMTGQAWFGATADGEVDRVDCVSVDVEFCRPAVDGDDTQRLSFSLTGADGRLRPEPDPSRFLGLDDICLMASVQEFARQLWQTATDEVVRPRPRRIAGAGAGAHSDSGHALADVHHSELRL